MDNGETIVPPPSQAPKSIDLFVASLIATGLVYMVGVVLIAVLVGVTSPSGGLADAAKFLAFFGSVGFFAAVFAGVLLVAPLGTAMGKAILRLTPAGWWQGPLTGVLVALALVALVRSLWLLTNEPFDMGTYAVAAIPVVLAPIAGAIVQRRFLRWPGNSNFEEIPS